MQLITYINFMIWLAFFICYLYQMYYILVPFIKKEKPQSAGGNNRFAVLISARNESNVIGELLGSINGQTYPKELVDVYVVADNCTDNTADIARKHGARVFERFNKEKRGKGRKIILGI